MNTPYTRAHIRLNSQNDVIALIQELNKISDTFVLENASGTRRVDAKSVIGVMYTMLDYNDQTYLVNDDTDGVFPAVIDQFRV